MARQNDHTRAEELISAYLDKQVSAEEKDFFERHLASCADCRAQLEATRSMIAALRAMPAVRAPRSFVLPREMGKQSRRSFLSLYPALRLATIVAALAFVVLFAGDLLLNQVGGSSAPQFIPAAAPAPAVMQAPEAAQPIAPTQEPAPAEEYSAVATAPVEQPAPPARAAAKSGATEVVTETAMAMTGVPTATAEATALADAAGEKTMMLSATPEPSELLLDQQAGAAAEQPAAASAPAPTPTIDWLRVLEIALLALVVVLGIATVIVRRRQA
jgi:anti-sigma factor RsiW